MQASKDSFYVTLRDRLALADPGRTITVDGVTRPAIVVVENDKPSVTARQQNAFYLEWGAGHAVRPAISTLMAMTCTVSYSSAGTEQNGGLDRGRMMGGLEAELLGLCSPAVTQKNDYTSGSAVYLGFQRFLEPADVQRGESRAGVRGARGQHHGLFLSRGEPVMNSNPYARQSQMWPLTEAVRAYVAPIERNSGTSVPFDPSVQGEFDLDLPPVPFLDLGWVENFQRTAATRYESLRTGPQSTLTAQWRAQFDAGVEFDLPNWGKLQMAVAGGGQQINVLATDRASLPQASGGTPVPAVYVLDEASMYELPLTADQVANFQIGDMVAVDWDYKGETGYVGAGAPGAYLAAALDVATHVDFIRRVSFNVSRVSNKTTTSLMLGQRLIGGAQTAMGVQKIAALLDREGGEYFQEWAALFVVTGGTGGRACFYYPRLQPAASTSEVRQEVEAPLFNAMLHAKLRAMPSVDANDGETVLCYRSYFPARTARV